MQFIEYSSAPLSVLGAVAGFLFEESAAATCAIGFSALAAFSLAHPAAISRAREARVANKTTILRTVRRCDLNVAIQSMFFIMNA